MDSLNSHPYLRQTHLPPLSSAQESPSALPNPHASHHQSNYYPSMPSPRSQPAGDLSRTANRSPSGYNPPDLMYSSHSQPPQSPSSIGASSMHEPLGDQYGAAGISPTNHLSTQGLPAPKRAYRQRRKDPSCDACRERKVKCDATETSSCSECLTRAVKCQFTKETNRRMSSIKQVQDLQNQLADAKRQIGQLQGLLQDVPKHRDSSPQSSHLKLPSLGYRLESQLSPPELKDCDVVRRSVRTYSRGVFKVPPMYRQLAPTPVLTASEVKLPPKSVTQTLLSQFYDFYNSHMPFLGWSAFTSQVERAYEADTLKGMTQVWVGLFFVVLACGTLQSTCREKEGFRPDYDGIQYMIIASRLLNTWTDNLSLDHARTSLMISMFLNEQNIRSAGWIWLGSAVRVSQDTGLHLESGPWSKAEGDARRMMYWAIFSYDRLLSLDGRPLQVYEDDHEVPWPNLNADGHSSLVAQSPTLPGTMPFKIPVIRFIPQLKKTLKSPTIARATLSTYDEYFYSIMKSYPEALQTSSSQALEPSLMHAVFPLQAARIMLYRHNLTVLCTMQERNEALGKCFSAALDTVGYIRRCMSSPPASPEKSTIGSGSKKSFEDSIRIQSDNFICKHIWRTTLILCFKGDYDSAGVCIRLSTIIGDMRKVNMACGRNLSWFLSQLLARVKSGNASPQQLESDEEMMAYASGDLQGDPENAWIWAGGGAQAQEAASTTTALTGTQNAEDKPPLTALLTEREMNDWGGWERVQNLLQELMQEQEKQRGMHQGYRESPHSTTKRLKLSPSSTPTPTTSSASAPPAGASRISIANII